MNIFRKLGCWLIGWKPEILAECGEASQRMYKKFLSAILIMSLLWGTIGYVFAGRYIGIEAWWGKSILSFAFIVVIVNIERIIILNVSKNKLLPWMRILLALCMALLGSFIFDQVIFQNDLNAEIKRNREEVIVPKIISTRMQTLQSTIDFYNSQIDSLGLVNEKLQAEIGNRSVIKATALERQDVIIGTDSLGNPIKTTITKQTEHLSENPKATIIKNNLQQIDKYQQEVSAYQQRKQALAENVRNEYLNPRKSGEDYVKVGFIEELNASVRVFFQSWISIIFYVVLFCFMLFLELFVVSIKFKEECDYDMIVEHQLEVKKRQLQNAQRIITEDFITRQMKKEEEK